MKSITRWNLHSSILSLTLLSTLAALLITAPQNAQAYIGPGAGVGAVGTAIALVGAVILLIVGFVWYPLKRLLRRGKKPNTENDSQS